MTNQSGITRRACISRLAVFFLTVLAGCASPPSRDHPALWHTRAQNGHELWIFGSIHRLPEDLSPSIPDATSVVQGAGRLIYRKNPASSRLRAVVPSTSWFHGPLKTAFRHSPVIMIEAAGSTSLQALFGMAASAGKHADCAPVLESLKPQSRHKLAMLLDSGAGVPAELPDSAAAALFAINTLESARNARAFDPGVDHWISIQALASGKEVIPLETARDRLDTMREAFEGKSCDDQARLLEAYITARSARAGLDEQDFERLVNRWRSGDMEALERQILRFQRQSETVFESLSGARNRLWLPRILDQVERSHSTLLVVGSAHLAGSENLLELIENKGFSIDRVQ